MKSGNDLRELAGGIIDSYEMRVKTVNMLMAQASHILKNFHEELEEMIARLRENLARTESLRKKDFDLMVGEVLAYRSRSELEAEEGLRRFQKEEDAMVKCLRDIVSGKDDLCHQKIKAIREDILRRQNEREKQVVRVLKRFQTVQEELQAGLKHLLHKGDDVRIKDLRVMVKSFKAHQVEENDTFVKMLEDFSTARERVHTQWQVVSGLSV